MDRQPSPQSRRDDRHGKTDVGDVVCRLDVVLLAAQRQHDLDIGTLASITRIDRRVLDALRKNQKGQYDLSVFARLCWVFDVQIGTFLEYLTPEQVGQDRASPRALGHITLPDLSLREPLPEDYGAIRCRLKEIIASRASDFLAHMGKPGKRHVSYPDLEMLLHIKAQRLSDWANNVPSRYDRVAMAELCHALRLGVDDLWVYASPGEAAQTSHCL